MRTSIRYLRALVVVMFLGACGEGPVQPTGADVAASLAGLQPWSQFSPDSVSVNMPVGLATYDSVLVDDRIHDCVSTPYLIRETPERIVTFDPDSNILWPGALLQGRGYKEGVGSLRELPVRERAPLQISVDLLTGDNTRIVENPTLASVNAAVGDIIHSAVRDGLSGGSSISYSQERSYSMNQWSLAVGLSFKYMTATIGAALDGVRKRSEKTVTANFVQRMFTVSVVLPQHPQDFFSDDFTPAKLQEQIELGNIGNDNPPVYVANIVYGRMLMFSVTSTAAVDSIKAAIGVSFTPADSSGITVGYANILRESKINVVAVGGEGRNAIALIRAQDLASYFSDDAALTSAKPISYTVRSLGDNSIAKVSESTNYNLEECTPRPTTGTLTIDVTPNDLMVEVSGPSGYQFSQTGDQILRDLQPGGYQATIMKGTASEKTDSVTVVAGATKALFMSLSDPIGGVYDFRFRSYLLTSMPVSCVGLEGAPEVFHAFKLNGQTAWEIPESGAVKRSEGTLVLPGGPGSPDGSHAAIPEVTLLTGEGVRAEGTITDSDTGANEQMGRFSQLVIPDNRSSGSTTLAAGVNNCVISVTVDWTRKRPIFGVPPIG